MIDDVESQSDMGRRSQIKIIIDFTFFAAAILLHFDSFPIAGSEEKRLVIQAMDIIEHLSIRRKKGSQ